jgi:asparagine synthase (glutamine-hydrolysing)
MGVHGASSILLDSSISGWEALEGSRWCAHYVGRRQVVEQVLSWLEDSGEHLNVVGLGTLLASMPNEWAFVAASSEYHIAATDKIRSYPLFYSNHADNCLISNSARLLSRDTKSELAGKGVLLEFAMAGYVTGCDTMYAKVKQLQAGDLVAFPSNGNGTQLLRYYRYLPQPEEGSSTRWVDELAETTESIFKRMIDSARGRPLLVPLSGGLDSRLIVCMLRHFGYDNVRTFSYGLPGNHEAKIARKVAAALGFPWEFVPTTHSGFRDFFWSPFRKSYSEFSDGLCSVPSMQDVHPLFVLRKRGLPNDTIIVNGQTGDFISGGHVPARLIGQSNPEGVIDAILDKHFVLHKSLRTPLNLKLMAERISHQIREIEHYAGRKLPSASLYESWEWQERQCKYVIGGQRAYDWLGLDWHLPFWDADYLKFWSRVPFELKLGQRLYREYLRSSDYYQLFRNFNPSVWRWPGATIAIVPIARAIGLLAGRQTKDRVYDYARYIGHYGPYYAPWGWRNFAQRSNDIRNPVTLFVDNWLSENGIGTPA